MFSHFTFSYFLYLVTFLAILSGCLTNCLPDAVPFLFAALVARFSPEDRESHAAFGKYLPRFAVGTAQDALIPIPVFYDVKTGRILKETLPGDIKDDYEDAI